METVSLPMTIEDDCKSLWYSAYIRGAGAGAGVGTYLHVRVRTRIYLHVRTRIYLHVRTLNSPDPSSSAQE